jgi:hypothetical protein
MLGKGGKMKNLNNPLKIMAIVVLLACIDYFSPYFPLWRDFELVIKYMFIIVFILVLVKACLKERAEHPDVLCRKIKDSFNTNISQENKDVCVYTMAPKLQELLLNDVYLGTCTK